MKNFIIGFLAVNCLMVSLALADVKAVINGPEEAKVGDLIVLSGRESVGDNMQWVQPQKIQTLLCGDGQDLAFATGTPGTYQFILIVANKEAEIAYVQHTVKVTGQIVTEPDPDPKPDPEEPTPPPTDLQKLVEISKAAADNLRDNATRQALANAIRETANLIDNKCAAGQCPGLVSAKNSMVMAIETTLLRRSGTSRSVDWLNGWRVPINAQLKIVNTADVPSYLAAMRAVALGLAGS